jgi:hypothetical protein
MEERSGSDGTRTRELRRDRCDQELSSGLEVGGGDVVEDKRPALQMTASERPLDPLLAAEQPLERRVQLVFVGVLDADSQASVDWEKARDIASFEPRPITRWTIIATRSARSRDGARSSSR